MVEYIKNLFSFFHKAKEDIPEVHLNKNEPNYYYDKDLNKWIIEDDVVSFEPKNEKVPPKHSQSKSFKMSSTASRYKNYLDSEKIIESIPIDLTAQNDNLTIKEKNKEIQELNDKITELENIITFNEENYEKSYALLKQQLDTFMNDNLSLKRQIDELKDIIAVKEKTLNENKELIKKYQEIMTSPSTSDNSNFYDNVNCNDEGNFLLLNSQIEQLKSEKLFLENDINQLETQNENYKKINIDLNNQISILKNELKKGDELQKSTASSLIQDNTRTLNQSSLININKLNSENYYLRSQIEILKNKNYELQAQNYSFNQEESIELTKIKNDLFKAQSQVLQLTNQNLLIRDFIQKETNKYYGLFKNLCGTFFSSEYSTTNLCIFIKKLLNKIVVLNGLIELTKEKEKSNEEEINNLKIENSLLKEKIEEKKKKTKKGYESQIISIKDQYTLHKKKYDDIINEYKKLKNSFEIKAETNKLLSFPKEINTHIETV